MQVSIKTLPDVRDLLVQWEALPVTDSLAHLAFKRVNFDGMKESVKKVSVNTDYLGYTLRIFEGKNGRCWLTCNHSLCSWKSTSSDENTFWVPCSINEAYYQNTKSIAQSSLRNAYHAMRGIHEDKLTPKMLVELYPKMLYKMFVKLTFDEMSLNNNQLLAFIHLFKLFVNLIETCRAGKFIQRRIEGYVRGEYYKAKPTAEDVIELLILQHAVKEISNEKQFNYKIVEDLAKSSISFHCTKNVQRNTKDLFDYSLSRTIWDEEKKRLLEVVRIDSFLGKIQSKNVLELLEANLGGIPWEVYEELNEENLSGNPSGWSFLFNYFRVSGIDGEHMLAKLLNVSGPEPEKLQKAYNTAFPMLA
eukprot:CAMPEP_0176408408 /NCGR_PEP_ID=MMETSP0127-20121128/1937_1 /TAXON_ID=938130 /ORGANISM="Platyophrya macrostoma, Strain WH" /LENGTH=360 /DNA_ID=CAMNT_0017787695 /DNA_START=190 /DNA_END=1272 /DNA_ORIENTATION=-